MNSLFPSCREAARRISTQHDALLNLPSRLGLFLHLTLCGPCRRYARHLRLLESCFREYPHRLLHTELPEHRRAEIVQQLMES